MSAEERDASDAVYVLNAIARLLRVSPHGADDPSWAELHATYLEDIAGAVARDASLDSGRLEDGAKYVGNEWETALIPILFGGDQAEDIFRRVRQL